jgi:hypothetical protein
MRVIRFWVVASLTWFLGIIVLLSYSHFKREWDVTKINANYEREIGNMMFRDMPSGPHTSTPAQNIFMGYEAGYQIK